MPPQRGRQGALRRLALPLLLACWIADCSCGAQPQTPLRTLHLPGVTEIASVQALPPKDAEGTPFGGVINQVVAYAPPSPASVSIRGSAPAAAGAASFHVAFLRDYENAYDVAVDGGAPRHLDVLRICLNHLDVTPDGRWLTCSDGTLLYSYAFTPAASPLPLPRVAGAGVPNGVRLSWAPDSQHFAAQTDVGGGCSIGIFATSAARDRVDVVARLAFPDFATTTSLGEVVCNIGNPVWSPDGAWLVLSAGVAESSLYALSLAGVLPDGLPTPPAMRSATVTPAQLVFLGTSDAFVPASWRDGPRGGSVTVVDRTHRGIVDIDLATHRQTTLVRIDEGEIDTLSWTRDGQHLVFAQGQFFCPDCPIRYTPSHLYVYTPSEASAQST